MSGNFTFLADEGGMFGADVSFLAKFINFQAFVGEI